MSGDGGHAGNGALAAIVLAAGGASRFGSAKQAALYGGKALVLHAVDAALAAGCERVIVVTGAHAAEVRQVLAQALPHNPKLSLVHNPDWPDGMASSIAAGATALLSEGIPESTFVTLADQPLVDAALLTRLDAARRAGRAGAAALAYPSGPGVPTCFSRNALPLLRQLEASEGGAKTLLRGGVLHVVTVDAPDARRDVDTLADWHDLPRTPPPDRP